MKRDSTDMKTKMIRIVLSGIGLSVLAVGLVSCGPPPAAGGPPSEFPVRAVLAAVEPSVLEENIRLVGSLRAYREIEVVSELSAIVEELLFEEGKPVSAGDPLIRLRDDRIRARLGEVEARFELAAANFVRGQDLLKANTISQADFDRLIAEYNVAAAVRDSARADLADAMIRAPFDGVMSERMISPGAFVRVGEPITRLVQTDVLEASFTVPERFIGQLSRDQVIRLRTTALPGEVFDGAVTFIDPRVDERSRTLLMRARVNNEDGRLKPGMFITLELVMRVNETALLIPEQAIQFQRDQAVVFIQNAEGQAERRSVSLGMRIPEKVEVVDGLAPGDLVVVEGHQKMGPGSRIIVSPASERFGVAVDSSPPA